jgi:hypothetical protein
MADGFVEMLGFLYPWIFDAYTVKLSGAAYGFNLLL